MSKTRIRSIGLGASGVLVLLSTASLALGAEQTRETYTAQVEPICKANTAANERILEGVKSEVRAGKLKPAAVSFAKAASALRKTLAQLKAVPRPAADTARLSKWLAYVEAEAELFERTAAKLRAGDKNGAQAMAIRLTRTANRANNQVLAFEFKYCRVDPSQFT